MRYRVFVMLASVVMLILLLITSVYTCNGTIEKTDGSCGL